MATKTLVVFENGQYRGRNSASETLDFLSVKVGASALEIKETSGNFDFSAKKLTNLAEPTANQDSATKYYVDQAIIAADAANKNLSNLNTTSINQHLLPSADSLRSLGSSSLQWLDAYVDAVRSSSGMIINAAAGNLALSASADIQLTPVADLEMSSATSTWSTTAGTVINSDADITVTADSDFTASANLASELLNMSAAGTVFTAGSVFTVNAVGNASLNSSAGSVVLDAGSSSFTVGQTSATMDIAGGYELFANSSADKIAVTTGGAFTIQGRAGITLEPGAGQIIDATSSLISNVLDPVSAQDAATKAYVDSVASGLDPKASCRVATVANITLSGTQTIDGVAVIAGDRVLVKEQTTGSQNGIYVVAAGAWARSGDADNAPGSEVTAGMFTFIEEGTSLQDTGWVLSTDNPITLGTTALVFTQFSSAGVVLAGAGLLKTGNTIDIVAADASISVGANDIAVARDAAGAIALSGSGIKINLEASAPSLQILSNELGIKFDAAGALSKGASGTKANVDGTSIEISSNALRIASGAAGLGLGYSAGVLAVNTGDGIQILSDAVAADYAKTMVNDNAGAITVGKIVYIKSNGAVDLAQANVNLGDAQIAIVSDASIASAASGKIYVRAGAVVGGFSGLTPGKRQYVSAATAGLLTETAPSASGQSVFMVGRAVSATEVMYDPSFIIELV